MTNNTISTASLARRYASAKNYLFEATMNDYSMESIRRGDLRKQEAEAALEAAGIDINDCTAWIGGRWVSTLDEPEMTLQGKVDLDYESDLRI